MCIRDRVGVVAEAGRVARGQHDVVGQHVGRLGQRRPVDLRLVDGAVHADGIEVVLDAGGQVLHPVVVRHQLEAQVGDAGLGKQALGLLGVVGVHLSLIHI